MTVLLLDRPFEETLLRSQTELDLRNIGPKVWPIVLSSCCSEYLRLYHVTLGSIDGIERLTSVRRLAIEWATKITDLRPVFQLNDLETLSVFDLSKLRQINGIDSLENLIELNLSGSRGSLTPRLKLESIEPVTKIKRLASFSLTNAQLDDDDITSLARCSNLKRLELSNQFDRSQFAYLAKNLNPQLEDPLSACFQTSLKCDKCGQDKSMFTGRRMPILCRSCDSIKFERHSLEFEKLVRDA